jgi:hypothetical protein
VIKGFKHIRLAPGVVILALLACIGAAEAVDKEDTGAMNGIGAVEAVVISLSGAASAEVVLTQSIVGNVLVDSGTVRRNAIFDSFNDGEGIFSVNQNSGDVTNQANIRSIALGKAGLVEAEIAATFEYRDNNLTVIGGERENRIVNSFNNTTGIVGVNQSAGNMNNQANIAAIAIQVGHSDGGFLPVADVSLGIIKTGNDENVDPTIPRQNVTANSFNNFAGVAQINQTAGDGNISYQSYILAVSEMTLP